MSDAQVREIHERLRELRHVAPKRELSEHAVGRVRVALMARRRRQILRSVVISCVTAAAAVLAIATFLRESPKPSPAVVIQDPQQDLKSAVDRSVRFEGLVQIRVEEMELDITGGPVGPIAVKAIDFDSVAGPVMSNSTPSAQALTVRPVGTQDDGRSRRLEAPQVRRTYVRTIPIPLTWRGGTIPIPVVPEGPILQPFIVEPGQSITTKQEGMLRRYEIKNSGSNEGEPRQANVWINPATGLVERVQIRTGFDPSKRITNIHYRYIKPNGQAPSTAPTVP